MCVYVVSRMRLENVEPRLLLTRTPHAHPEDQSTSLDLRLNPCRMGLVRHLAEHHTESGTGGLPRSPQLAPKRRPQKKPRPRQAPALADSHPRPVKFARQTLARHIREVFNIPRPLITMSKHLLYRIFAG